MTARIVTVDLDTRSYDAYVGPGLLARLEEFVPFEIAGLNLFIVTDENAKIYSEIVQCALVGAASVHVYVLTSGERRKSFAEAEKITLWMLERGLTRRSAVIAVGGGVVGDIAGFCAAIAMRGVPYVQVPTTLLAQVDSSVGGKTGVNTVTGKNLIGAFHQPAAVIADTDTLKTLPAREFLAGYAEVVKYAFIGDAGFFTWLEDHAAALREDADLLAQAVETSIRAKAKIVQADEHEQSGLRALLNFGHTFGHALETAAQYDGRLLHGEAVAIGMTMAFDLSVRLGLCPAADAQRAEAHMQQAGLPTRAGAIDPPLTHTPEKLLAIMGGDKKAEGGALRFVVSEGIGAARLESGVDDAQVLAVLRASLGEPASGKGKWTAAFSSHS